MKTPGTVIHVEELVFSIARILFVFNLNKPAEIVGPQEAFGQLLNFGKFDGLDTGCCTAEFAGMLTHTTGQKGGRIRSSRMSLSGQRKYSAKLAFIRFVKAPTKVTLVEFFSVSLSQTK